MERRGYNTTAVLLHWIVAVSIFFLFISSWWMLALPLPSKVFEYREIPFQLHKNIGITLVAVLLLFLYVRFRHRPAKDTSSEMKPWMHKMAALDHVLLYLVIFACCISGYMSSSFSGWNTTLWWTVDLYYWGWNDEARNIFWSDIHLWTCWALLGLMAVHISGSLYHAFRNDGVVRRMLRL